MAKAFPILALVLAPALALASCSAPAREAAATSEPEGSGKPTLGLMSTLPIYWPESGEFGDFLREDSERSWVRTALEEGYLLEPLDAIEDDTLAGVDLLVLAQPRALSAAENVALDRWVRNGGRALILADPMLTRHSRFAIGDRRRPQDVVLLSPILARWGLQLTFDANQEEGERSLPALAARMPVNVAGRFVPGEREATARCRIESDGLIARCEVGKGSALLMADAAILDGDGNAERTQALARLVAAAQGR